METIEMLRILDECKKILDKIDIIDKQIQPKKDEYRSTDISSLAEAFAKAQGEFGIIYTKHDGHGRYFDYRFEDYDSIMRVIAPVLSKYGLSIAPYTEDINGAVVLHTQLHHASGQWRETRIRLIPPEDHVHALSSMNLFLRKDQLLTLLGIAPSNEDDDGAAAMARTVKEKDKGISLVVNAQKEQEKNSYERITKEQLEEVNYILKGWPDIAKDVKDTLGIRVLADMAKEDYHTATEKIRAIIYRRTEAGLKPETFS